MAPPTRDSQTRWCSYRPDAVAEFQVVTNNMGAEYGRSGCATINVVTKYGTNSSTAAYGSSCATRIWTQAATSWPDYGGKPSLHQNQFGGTLGGPLKQDKLFFFVDYEGFRQIQLRHAGVLPCPTRLSEV